MKKKQASGPLNYVYFDSVGCVQSAKGLFNVIIYEKRIIQTDFNMNIHIFEFDVFCAWEKSNVVSSRISLLGLIQMMAS